MSGNQARLMAVSDIVNRQPMAVDTPASLKDIWGTDVFNLATMEEMLSKKAFKAMKNTVQTGAALDTATADVVAAAMKDWAISKGVKFFSHIFYPMTNATAEKHDGFIVTNSDGNAITEFTGSLLIKGEPDGSSFPNGSLRMTNAARGYTAWDPTSPAYIMHTANGSTLMIPSVFMSWTGEALDKKIPLLRSNAAMNTAAQKVLSLMGETEIATLNSSCGAEQEYFLIDAGLAAARPDLQLAGRSLFGAPPAKGQQFDDHYFGAIPERVQVFMQDFEDRMYRLGIPAKTHHNEVAPGQFEIAPYFEAANVASDHQQMLMTLMKQTAKKHGFLCLLHEKPFAGVNGSGKHVNWSVGNATQGNLLDPGDTPAQNLNFLLFCGAVIRGVHMYGPLLRAAIASAANDHRLGANEAPPAILSVYLGDQLEKLFMDIKAGTIGETAKGGLMDIGLDQILKFERDPGDRNRTSPFAFTGNRFEFRAVGSSQSVSGPLVAMNTMLADSLNWIAEKLEAALATTSDKAEAVVIVLKELMELHSNVIFGGDGYSSEWHTKAVEERGLKNIPTTADALPAFQDPAVIALFESTGVLTPVELASRFEVYAEQYILSIEVESKLVVDMAKTSIYPAAMSYFSSLTDTLAAAAELSISLDKSTVTSIGENINSMMTAVAKLEAALASHDFDSTNDHIRYCADTPCPLMLEVRGFADTLETMV
ncbi:MAG: glutamine synthetase III, partial [Oceanobacter sp.]